MNLHDTPEQAAFRQGIRAWIDRKVPPQMKGRDEALVTLSKQELMPLRMLLAGEGWLLPYMPKQYGGAEFDPIQTIIFMEEMAAAGVPYIEARGSGIANITAVLLRWGSPEQKERLLKPTLAGTIFWCQGYSEPGSGSDLASLQTRAAVTPEGFVIDGQKIWTSRAHESDWIFLLARTDPAAKRKQDGISFFVFDMKTPGISIRPLITLDGRHYFNQTFYDHVQVPQAGLVGELNKGWTVAKALLVHERLNSPGANPNTLAR
ncbi:MAG: acyl-CoA dehydrogenase family protein, partial [Candidatus Lambdaproteobacteria bacterium]|nr:acyl-CoA dehydrogenase family protein [Candidatus Lambdaproteobacteria bacterium]